MNTRSIRGKRLKILKRDGGYKKLVDHERCQTIQWHINCKYCSSLLEGKGVMRLDHIIPRSKGGTNELDNLVICCEGCNSQKADKSLVDFLSERSIMSV